MGVLVLGLQFKWGTIIYLLGYKIIFQEVFWYPIILVFILTFFLDKLGTEKPLEK